MTAHALGLKNSRVDETIIHHAQFFFGLKVAKILVSRTSRFFEPSIIAGGQASRNYCQTKKTKNEIHSEP